jgi:hypothetical protein
MTAHYGSKDILDIVVNDKYVNKVYYGSKLVYQRKTIYASIVTAGTTTISLPRGKYQIILVGSGGGSSNYSGGAGAYWNGYVTLTANGSATITIGSVGAGAGAYCRNNNGRTAADSSIVLTGGGTCTITCAGGGGGCGRRNCSSIGTTSAPSITSDLAYSTTEKSSSGNTATSWYNGYGQGGAGGCEEYGSNAGSLGYAYIRRI